ncbi:hypothetical protein CR513_38441, partial [Mucuna pruriens]
MCPTLQETELDHLESIGTIGGYQYRKQLYQSRKLTISGGPDEVVSNEQPGVSTKYELQQYAVPAKHERYHPSTQDANRIASKHYEPFTGGQIRCRLIGTSTREVCPIANSTRKLEFDEELLKMFRKVEINMPLLDAIKQIPKYAKYLKELCIHKRKKIKRGVELGGIVSTLTKNDDIIIGAQQALPKKCRKPKIFSIPCTISDCTFADAMLDLGASINVMPTSIYKSLNFGDLEPTRMTIQLANRSVVQPLGVLKDVLVQVNELIFPADFYVLDMKEETSGKGSTLILGRLFLMTARTKIDVHARILSMEFGDNLVQFNIFEAMKHPTEDHSLFGIDLIGELVEEHLQLDAVRDDISIFVGDTNLFDCIGSIIDEADDDKSWEVHNLSDSEDDITNLANLSQEVELLDLLNQVCKYEDLECSNNTEVQVVKIKKQLSMQVTIMFTIEYESANRGRDRKKVEVDSVKKTSAKFGLIIHSRVKAIRAEKTRSKRKLSLSWKVLDYGFYWPTIFKDAY